MGLFLDPLASVNEARGLDGTAATPSNGIQGSFSCKDNHLVHSQPTEVNKNSLIQTLSGLLPSVPSENEVPRKEKLPSEASDYCNVCLLCCLLVHVVMYLCSYFYYKYMTTNCQQVLCAFLHLKISSVSDAISNREIVTTQRPRPQTRTGTGTAERLNQVAEQNTMMMGQSKGRCPKKQSQSEAT